MSSTEGLSGPGVRSFCVSCRDKEFAIDVPVRNCTAQRSNAANTVMPVAALRQSMVWATAIRDGGRQANYKQSLAGRRKGTSDRH
jgi:hypothetical protein